MKLTPKGPWHIDIAEEEKEYGMGEDCMLYCFVYFLIATNKEGFCYIGPLLGNNRDNSMEEIKQKAAMWDASKISPDTDDNWQYWFPVYGSKAYESSGQELANLEAERRNEPYRPASW